MTIRRLNGRVYVECRGCRARCHASVKNSLSEARAAAKADGWRRINGDEWCPPCLAAKPFTAQAKGA